MTNAIVKAMYLTVDIYSMVYATLTTWEELAIEKHPLLTAVVNAVIINYLFL